MALAGLPPELPGDAVQPLLLFVDDEEQIAASLARFARAYGYRAAFATNIEDAWEHYLTHSPDLVVTDVEMHHPDAGLELARRVRDSARPCPVLLLSGSPLPPNVSSLAVETLYKPAALEELLAAVERSLLAHKARV